jgi:hypothetical protein
MRGKYEGQTGERVDIQKLLTCELTAHARKKHDRTFQEQVGPIAFLRL